VPLVEGVCCSSRLRCELQLFEVNFTFHRPAEHKRNLIKTNFLKHLFVDRGLPCRSKVEKLRVTNGPTVFIVRARFFVFILQPLVLTTNVIPTPIPGSSSSLDSGHYFDVIQ
jgi:hypothetical protein